jgi:MoxR-like ATPase
MVAASAARLREAVARRIVGMDDVVHQVLITVVAGSHGLLVGVPGLAKTLLVSSVAEVLGLTFKRIQFTPDLMPSDIVGTESLGADETGLRRFRFQRGPVFTNLLLADEINRTPPKTQAALMEAMEEGQITSAGRRYALDPPFLVLATQNPIEQEGTYPLPAAQLDRFLLQIHVGYPDREDEKRMVRRTAGRKPVTLEPILSREEVLALSSAVRAATSPEDVTAYAVSIVRSTRPSGPDALETVAPLLAFGAGPRAAGALLLAAKARAVIDGRPSPTKEDVQAVVHPVLRHRLILSFQATAEGKTTDDVIDRAVEGAAAKVV